MTILRALFFLLVIANLIMLGAATGLFGGGGGREPERLAAQMEPDKIQVLRPADAAAREEASASAPAPQIANAERCIALVGLTREQLAKWLPALQGVEGLKVSERPLDPPTSYWVYIPPLPDRAAVEEKLAELRALGLGPKDFYVMSEAGAMKNAVSLAVFKSEALADEFLQRMERKGVRGARVAARSGSAGRFALDLRGPADLVDQRAAQVGTDIEGLKQDGCPPA